MNTKSHAGVSSGTTRSGPQTCMRFSSLRLRRRGCPLLPTAAAAAPSAAAAAATTSSVACCTCPSSLRQDSELQWGVPARQCLECVQTRIVSRHQRQHGRAESHRAAVRCFQLSGHSRQRCRAQTLECSLFEVHAAGGFPRRRSRRRLFLCEPLRQRPGR